MSIVELVFPDANLIIKLRKKKNIYTVEDILCLLSCIRRYELGGEYISRKGFHIDTKVTHYDYDSDRPYTTLNLQSPGGIIWHSHPFGIKLENSFPSIEDIQVSRENPSLIFLIITGRGVYIISTIRNVSEGEVIQFYNSMDDDDIESNFVNYEFVGEEFGIFISCISLSIITLDMIDQTVSFIKELKSL